MADLDSVAARLDRALDRIERALTARPAGAGPDDAPDSEHLKQEIAQLAEQRATLAREHEALEAEHRALDERCRDLEQTGAEVSLRLEGAIAGITRLLEGARPKNSAPR